MGYYACSIVRDFVRKQGIKKKKLQNILQNSVVPCPKPVFLISSGFVLQKGMYDPKHKSSLCKNFLKGTEQQQVLSL